MKMTVLMPRVQAWFDSQPMFRGALILIGSAFIVLALVGMFATTVATSHEVVSAQDAGHLVKARFISAVLDGDRTEVETTTATFLVYGAMVAMKGSALKHRDAQERRAVLVRPIHRRLQKAGALSVELMMRFIGRQLLGDR